MKKVLDRFKLKPNTSQDQANNTAINQTQVINTNNNEDITNVQRVQMVNPAFDQNDECIEIDIENRASVPSN